MGFGQGFRVSDMETSPNLGLGNTTLAFDTRLCLLLLCDFGHSSPSELVLLTVETERLCISCRLLMRTK